MKERKTEIFRKTAETEVRIELNIDGKGEAYIDTGVGFLNHMLTLFAKHGGFDLKVCCKGDTDVDDHHSVEDVGIVLGDAFRLALGEKKGIRRYGDKVIPMDEALILSAVDFSGRSYLEFDLEIPTEKVGNFDTELVQEFFTGFARNAECTLHILKLKGTNSHHIIEGAFKSVARSMKEACEIEERFSSDIPSTKGVL